MEVEYNCDIAVLFISTLAFLIIGRLIGGGAEQAQIKSKLPIAYSILTFIMSAAHSRVLPRAAGSRSPWILSSKSLLLLRTTGGPPVVAFVAGQPENRNNRWEEDSKKKTPE